MVEFETLSFNLFLLMLFTAFAIVLIFVRDPV